jgi:enamine deaminase RidA (YjgF/YER057c/UK114 family)
VAEIPISQEEIDNLGRQLDGITGNERVLLSGIVAVAAQAIAAQAVAARDVAGGPTGDPGVPAVVYASGQVPPVSVEVEEPLPALRDQIAKAFTPGAIEPAADVDIDSVRIGHVLSVRVGHDPHR